MEINGGWGFPETLFSLSLKKIYYILSPAVFPLPPEVRLYYTEGFTNWWFKIFNWDTGIVRSIRYTRYS